MEFLQDRKHGRSKNKSQQTKKGISGIKHFSKHKTMKLEINYRKKNGKNTNNYKTKKYATKNQ